MADLTSEQAALQRDYEIEQGIQSSSTPGNRPEDDATRAKNQAAAIESDAQGTATKGFTPPNNSPAVVGDEPDDFRSVLEGLPDFTSDQVSNFLKMDRDVAISGLKASKKYGKQFEERLANWTPIQRTYNRLKDIPSPKPPTWLQNIANSTPVRFMNDVVLKSGIDTAKVLGDVVVDSTVGVPTRFVQSMVSGKELSLKDVLPGASAFSEINPEMKAGYEAADKTQWGKATADAFQLAQEAALGGAVGKLLTAPTKMVNAERSILGSKNIVEAGKVGAKGSSVAGKTIGVVKQVAPYIAASAGASALRGAIRDSAGKIPVINNLISGGGKNENTTPQPTTPSPVPNNSTTNNNTTNNSYTTNNGTSGDLSKLLAGIANVAAPVVKVALSNSKGQEASFGGSLGHNQAAKVVKKKRKHPHKKQSGAKGNSSNSKKNAKLEKNKVKGTSGKSELRKDKKASLPGSSTQSTGLKEKHGK